MLDKTETIKRANAVDIHVGGRIRLRRKLIGLSQEKLAERIGVTFQQVQKYEKGTNRVGASRLQSIAGVLNVAPSFFFEGAPGADGGANDAGGEVNDIQRFVMTGEGIQLYRGFTAIKDANTRHKILGLIKAVAHLGEEA
ncbi:helix-turn-helix domain-containing protein [Shinella pollutisoli]|uniref:Helix-turn-helix domain-containing protein n=1 Tax=Shinella pollutisoli TaxID=2250594 RepID=A0ABV7DKH0_9HYPH|nr:helix-turn-helix transcriptional regulator [Shinella pollutisoli]